MPPRLLDAPAPPRLIQAGSFALALLGIDRERLPSARPLRELELRALRLRGMDREMDEDSAMDAANASALAALRACPTWTCLRLLDLGGSRAIPALSVDFSRAEAADRPRALSAWLRARGLGAPFPLPRALAEHCMAFDPSRSSLTTFPWESLRACEGFKGALAAAEEKLALAEAVEGASSAAGARRI